MDDDLASLLDDPDTRPQAWDELRARLPESRDAVIAGLQAGSPTVRRACAGILDHAPHDPLIEQALRTATADADWKVRKAALHALSCQPCKPDGCLTSDGVGVLVDAMLHDRDGRVRRACAGVLMWGQHGTEPRIVEAFRTVLATEANGVMRERAATFLASLDVPRDGRPHRDWVGPWKARVADLLSGAG